MTDSPSPSGAASRPPAGRESEGQRVHIDEILYSPLSRAADTAMAITEATGLPAWCEPRLRSSALANTRARPATAASSAFPKTHFADRYDGGESMMQLAQRIYNLLTS